MLLIDSEGYLLYTILYSPVNSISSNFTSNLMIANSKITVFPDPVGADTTIDASVKHKLDLLLSGSILTNFKNKNICFLFIF